MAERVASLGVDERRLNVLPNWANVDHVRPVAHATNALRHAHGLTDKFVVMYSGNHGVSHRFDDIVEVARRFQRRREIVFLFVGRGARASEIRRAAASLGNIRCLDFQPYSRLSESLGMGDLHFISLRNGFEGLVVPSKAYGVLAAGRPLLYQGDARGEVARMIHEDELGAVVAQGDVDQLTLEIERAYKDVAWRCDIGLRARRVAEAKYGHESYYAAYRKALLG